MKFIVKIFLLSFFLNCFAYAQVKTNQKNNSELAKVIELYNKKNYQEAIDLLEKNTKIRDENANWYYYYGLNMARLDKYDEAIDNLDLFVKKTDINSSARAYYLIGLMHFYKGNYKKAISNLDVSLDVSKDPKLDKTTDALIDKVVRYQNYYQNRKSTNLSFLIGYNYDLNTLNLSQNLSQEKLDGHVFNYGFSLSHRFIDTLSLVFEPSLTIYDSYTLDRKFNANSLVQEGDVLQGILTAPVVFNTDKERSNSQYEISANAYTTFAPVTSNKRQQYVSSYFLKASMTADLSALWNFAASNVLAYDQSVVFLNEDSKSNGNRVELELALNRYLNKEKNTGVGIEFLTVAKQATGKDARYSKHRLAIGYWFPSFYETSSLLRLNYGLLTYPDRTVARKDNKLNLDYYLSQTIMEETALLSYFFGVEKNESNYDVNTYNDVKVGIAFTKKLGF